MSFHKIPMLSIQLLEMDQALLTTPQHRSATRSKRALDLQ